MSDRKAELEKKRRKLEELRKARDQKKKEALDKEVRVVSGWVDFFQTVTQPMIASGKRGGVYVR